MNIIDIDTEVLRHEGNDDFNITLFKINDEYQIVINTINFKPLILDYDNLEESSVDFEYYYNQYKSLSPELYNFDDVMIFCETGCGKDVDNAIKKMLSIS